MLHFEFANVKLNVNFLKSNLKNSKIKAPKLKNSQSKKSQLKNSKLNLSQSRLDAMPEPEVASEPPGIQVSKDIQSLFQDVTASEPVFLDTTWMTPLRELDALTLVKAIIAATTVTTSSFSTDTSTSPGNQIKPSSSPSPLTPLQSSILLAAHLHREDTRTSESPSPTPYIIHPLRNALRLIRLGATDLSLLQATVLHDVVEDHAFELAALALPTSSLADTLCFEKAPEPAPASAPASASVSAESAREISLQHISSEFGESTARIVSGMSNPLSYDTASTLKDRNVIYLQHVQEATSADAYVFVCKAADLIDNAGGLMAGFEHHYQPRRAHTNTMESGDEKATRKRRATKYLPAISYMEERLVSMTKNDKENEDFPLPIEGVRKMKETLTWIKKELGKILDEQQK